MSYTDKLTQGGGAILLAIFSDESQRGGESLECLLLEHSSRVETDSGVENPPGESFQCIVVGVEFVYGAQLLAVVIFHNVRVRLGFCLVELHFDVPSGLIGFDRV